MKLQIFPAPSNKFMTNDSKNFDDLPYYFNKGEDVLNIGHHHQVCKPFSAGEYDFIRNDDIDLYNKNLKTQPEDWYYRTNKVKYTLNSYGYRTKEFDKISISDSIVIFGCSFVFGVGLDDDDTLSKYLSQYAGKYVINMGIPAASNELILYNSLMFKRKYGIPYAVIYLWSSHTRSTCFSTEEIMHIGPWMTGLHFNQEIFISSKYDWDINTPIKTYYNIMCAKEIWGKNTILYNTTLFPDTSKYGKIDILPYWISTARDLSHPCRETNKLNAEYLYNKLKDSL